MAVPVEIKEIIRQTTIREKVLCGLYFGAIAGHSAFIIHHAKTQPDVFQCYQLDD
jgi:hypothetical protein